MVKVHSHMIHYVGHSQGRWAGDSCSTMDQHRATSRHGPIWERERERGGGKERLGSSRFQNHVTASSLLARSWVCMHGSIAGCYSRLLLSLKLQPCDNKTILFDFSPIKSSASGIHGSRSSWRESSMGMRRYWEQGRNVGCGLQRLTLST